MDMTQTIVPKSTQLNADDLISGPRTVRITKVSANPDSPEQPVAVSFDGDNGRPFMPCKTVRRIMVNAWGPDASAYVGRSMTLYRDPAVKFGGMQVGGIRISHMSHIERDMTMALTETRAKRAPFTVKRLAEQAATKPAALDAKVEGDARAAASGGTEAFRKWWGSNPDHRAALKPLIDELKRIAADADDGQRDAFGLKPLPEPAPDPDALAAAEEATLAEIRARDEQEAGR